MKLPDVNKLQANIMTMEDMIVVLKTTVTMPLEDGMKMVQFIFENKHLLDRMNISESMLMI